MATKIPRKPLQLAWGLTLMLGLGGAALAQPQLTCQVTYAGATQTVVARPVAGADAVIGGHPHVTQDIEHIQGKPIIYSVGNFVMKETDNANQRRGWVLRLDLDKHGVRGFDTLVAQIRMDGVPERDDRAVSPCWQRGDAAVGQCVVGQRP